MSKVYKEEGKYSIEKQNDILNIKVSQKKMSQQNIS